VVLDHGPGWTADDIGESGCDVVVAYRADKPDAKHPAWPGGRPRFGFVVKGAFCYDPRLDDTVPGGSGPHRDDDAATWEWSPNAAICRYKWVRGVYANDDVSDQSKLLLGRGLTAEEAPPENIFAAANLCDEVAANVFEYVQPSNPIASTGNYAITADGTIITSYSTGGSPIEWFSAGTRAYTGTSVGTPPLLVGGSVINIDLADDGTAYFFGQCVDGGSVLSQLYTCARHGSYSRSFLDGPWFSGPIRVFDLDAGPQIFVAMPSGTLGGGNTGFIDLDGYHEDLVTSLAARDFCLHADGSIWGVFQPDGSSADFTLKRLGISALSYTATGLVTRSAISGATVCHVAAFAHFFVVSDGKWYTVHDDTTGTPGVIKASGSWSGQTLNLPRKTSAAATFWSGYSEIDLEDGSTIRTVDPADWLAESAGSGDHLYDSVNHGIWNHAAGHETIRLLDRHGGYRVAGPIYANQAFLEVEEMFAAATGGNIVTREGSVELEPGQAKSVSFTFTDDDLIVGSKVSWNRGIPSEASPEWVNTVVARYVEPSQQWNDHAAPVLRDTADIIADGKPREASITLRLVRYQAQALRVGEINRRLGRIWGRGQVTLGPRFCEVEDGDWGQWVSARLGMTVTVRVDAYRIDGKWQITLTLREIAASVYADDAVFPSDQSTAEPTPSPPDVGAPEGANWALTAITLDSLGASIPALHIEGDASDDDFADQIIFEYWQSDGVTDPAADPDAIPWTMEGSHAPSTTQVDITSIAAAATYYAAVSYVVSGIAGDRLVLGPVTVADFDFDPVLTLEDDATPLHLEDGLTMFRLG
jgi:hypothetical protein